MNNGRQLMLGWIMYANDHHDDLVPNGSGAQHNTNSVPSWVYGDMKNSADRTDPLWIQVGLLYPYLKSVKVYKCPGNHTTEVRGISMNNHMNQVNLTHTPGYTYYTKLSSIRHPSRQFVTIDEDESSINDGLFVARDQSIGNSYAYLADWPATYHNGGAGIAFSDGHAIIHKWVGIGHAPPNYDSAAGPRHFSSSDSGLADAKYLTEIGTLPIDGDW